MCETSNYQNKSDAKRALRFKFDDFEQFVRYWQILFEVNSNGLYIAPEEKEGDVFFLL